MDLNSLFKNKTIKSKAKATMLASLLLNNELKIDRLTEFAASQKKSDKSICIEAIEFAVKANPAIATPQLFEFIVQSLKSDSSRSRWEAGKVIGHIAKKFPDKIQTCLPSLLTNTRDESTVVRWSAAYALAEIAALKTKANKTLLPELKDAIAREEKNSIVKIYLQALKRGA